MTSCVVQRVRASSQWCGSAPGLTSLLSDSNTTTRRSNPSTHLHTATVTRFVRDSSTSPTRLSHPALSTAAPSDTRLPTLPSTLSIPSNTHTGTPSARSPRTKPLSGDVTYLSSYKTNTSRYCSGVVGLVTSGPAGNKRHRCRTRNVNTATPILLFSGCRSNKSHM